MIRVFCPGILLGLWSYTFSRVLCGAPVAAADSVYLQLRLTVPAAGYTCRLARDLLYKSELEPSSTQGSPGLLGKGPEARNLSSQLLASVFGVPGKI